MTPDAFDRLVRARRSVRGYKPDPVAPEVIDATLKTALWAPVALRRVSRLSGRRRSASRQPVSCIETLNSEE